MLPFKEQKLGGEKNRNRYIFAKRIKPEDRRSRASFSGEFGISVLQFLAIKMICFQPLKRYAMKENLTIGFPDGGADPVVLCGGRDGFHMGCTDEPDGKYDVLANHNNWEWL